MRLENSIHQEVVSPKPFYGTIEYQLTHIITNYITYNQSSCEKSHFIWGTPR